MKQQHYVLIILFSQEKTLTDLLKITITKELSTANKRTAAYYDIFTVKLFGF